MSNQHDINGRAVADSAQSQQNGPDLSLGGGVEGAGAGAVLSTVVQEARSGWGKRLQEAVMYYNLRT